MRKLRTLVAIQVLCLLTATIVAPAQAAAISTAELLAAQQRSTQLAAIDAALASEEVRQQLERFGVTPQEAQARVASLTPAELQLLANRMDTLPAGSSVLGLIGAVFVVLLVLELVGVTDVFSKI